MALDVYNLIPYEEHLECGESTIKLLYLPRTLSWLRGFSPQITLSNFRLCLSYRTRQGGYLRYEYLVLSRVRH